MNIRNRSLVLSGVLALSLLLTGCGGRQPQQSPSGAGGFDLRVCIATEPQTMDPTLNQTSDGGTMFLHLFDGLYHYVDDGRGRAVLAPGLAKEEPQVTAHDDGTCTYTFTLREDARWSDGRAVAAGDLVYSWRRLVDPATLAPYNYMLNMVVNANEIMAGEKPPEELGVSAPDERTFVVDLTYNCPYFTQVCAFPTCVPLREDVISANPKGWMQDPATYVSNGPYRLSAWVHNSSITMARNEGYYDPARQGPDTITWKLMEDTRAMLTAMDNHELDFMLNAPVDEVATLLAEGRLIPGENLATYYACFNNARAPFDDPRVRKAFSLAIDRNYIVEKITQVGELPAGGWVPAGLDDVGGPDSPDFRSVGGDWPSVRPEDYEANCALARELLAQAGYPEGRGFPQITYLYNTDNRHSAIAEALQRMWKTQLGVELELDNQDWNVFVETRNKGEYSICRNSWSGDYNDPMTFMDLFLTGGGNNSAFYSNERYDSLIRQAQHTSDAGARMEMMHEAERLLIEEDAGIAPIFFYTQPYLIADRVEGMFATPLGYFFFMNTAKA